MDPNKCYQMDGRVLKKQMHCNFSWLSFSFNHVNQADGLHNINLKGHILIIIIFIFIILFFTTEQVSQL